MYFERNVTRTLQYPAWYAMKSFVIFLLFVYSLLPFFSKVCVLSDSQRVRFQRLSVQINHCIRNWLLCSCCKERLFMGRFFRFLSLSPRSRSGFYSQFWNSSLWLWINNLPVLKLHYLQSKDGNACPHSLLSDIILHQWESLKSTLGCSQGSAILEMPS